MSKSSPSRHGRSVKLGVECLEDRTTPTFIGRPGTEPVPVNAPPVININGLARPSGGLSIAGGDLFPDPLANAFGLVANEIVTGTGPGVESLVRVYRRGGTLLNAFVPFAGFTGGINVAVGDVTGDGEQEIIAAIAANGPPHVKVFNAGGQLLSSFYAFTPGFTGGLNIATGNVIGGIAAGGFSGGAVSTQFKQEIIIGTASGTSHVVATDAAGNYLSSFLAFPGFTGGVTVAAANIDTTRSAGFVFGAGQGDTNAYDEIIVGAASKTPHVKVFSTWTGTPILLESYYAFDPASGQGITVAAGSTDGIPGAEVYASLIGTSNIRVFTGSTGQLYGQVSAFPSNYTGALNISVGSYNPLIPYNEADDDTLGAFNPDFLLESLLIVTGDGSFEQEPRFFIGLPGSPAPFNGP